jgi:hypothetical protein
MIASKVSFSAHTKEMLNARPLSRTARAKLRRQRIVEYIRELPFGECKKADLITAGGWDMSISSHYANGWSFIERMVKNNIIRMTEGSNPKNSYIKKWEVVADTHIIKPRVETVQFRSEPAPVAEETPVVEPADEPSTFSLLEEAKNFAWNTNSDSLREFVAWVKR